MFLSRSMATAKSLPKVLVIAGTTAVGKTKLSLELAERLGGEIISADSVQVYRHLDIGSAKVDETTRQLTPHHLIDVAEPNDQFSASEYYDKACRAIQGVIDRGKVPIVVGGTSFYLRFLVHGKTGAPIATPETVAAVDKLLASYNNDWQASIDHLAAIDPDYAAGLSPNDWYRVKRALCICLQTGRTVTSFKRDKDSKGPYDFRCLFLSMPRLQLFQRIDARAEEIIHGGLLKEVASLVTTGQLQPDTSASRSVGYRQAIEYLQRVWAVPSSSDDQQYQLQIPQDQLHSSFLQLLTSYQARTRNLASSQLTWFKSQPAFHWVNVTSSGVNRSLADDVADWFINETPLPEEWDGTILQNLSSEEKKLLILYRPVLSIYHQPESVAATIRDLENHLGSLPQNK